ncbi:MAG: DUF2911 domain-containing protein [Gemmatimonadales bacterium]
MRGTEWWSSVLLVGAVVAAVPVTAMAQLRASENFAVTQIVDGDTIGITGSRPSLRGRVMYGTQLPWGKNWTPGANMATVLRVDRDFRIDGTPVPAGRYSVWMVPRADDQWSLILDPRAGLFHTAHPDSTAEQYHFRLTARTIEPVETLTWSINEIRGWRSRVQMAWADKAVDFELRLSAGEINLQVAEQVARPLVGTYDVPAEFRKGPFLFERIVISWADGILAWRVEGGNAPDWFDGTTWVLVPRGVETYGWMMVYDGEVVGQAQEMVIEVAESGARAAAIEFRGVPGDQLFLRAVRDP